MKNVDRHLKKTLLLQKLDTEFGLKLPIYSAQLRFISNAFLTGFHLLIRFKSIK